DKRLSAVILTLPAVITDGSGNSLIVCVGEDERQTWTCGYRGVTRQWCLAFNKCPRAFSAAVPLL
uniref:Uncharacterized protein n=1 Tax=Salarias fasciatus TaxID=181472 RepID=A0A672IUY3_SALFA